MKLRYYVLTRLALAIPTMFILLTSVFIMMHVLPGDPVLIMYGEYWKDEYIDAARARLGLDRPMYVQYMDYMGKFVRFDLGDSLTYNQPVWYKIKDRWPLTLECAVGGLLFSLALGLPVGIYAALKKGSKIDQIIRIFTLYLHSVPNFWVALMLQIFFGLTLGVLPISGRWPPGFRIPKITGIGTLDALLQGNINGFIIAFKHMLLPWFVIGLSSLPYMSRIARAAMLNVLGEDYITTARAKGLAERVVVVKHGLRNALLPIITIVGGSFTGMLGGTVIVETIFTLPGIGSLLSRALSARDYPMIQGIVALMALVVVVMNTIVDIIYAYADPRIKY